MLIEDNAEVNAVDGMKKTALHYAAPYGHFDVVKVVLQNGADVNAVTKLGETVLYICFSGQHSRPHRCEPTYIQCPNIPR